ncbi:hypothetical protein GCM10012278_24490 [Nonomuraea glycinis]|uniref:Uncharacterized protein n=1 Tax=Nonomuraea glycinis TaxID=2047744 RepID=A0A918A456_9ACTN|nr:hypothetical protein GCM10012278_24490 [Nonomuraea glycinis]
MVAGLGRADGDPERLGRLAYGPALHVNQIEHVPVLGGQGAEHLSHEHGGHHGVRVVSLLGLLVGRFQRLPPGDSGAGPVDHDVAGHLEQPASHRSLAVAEPLRVLPCPDQRLLEDVLGPMTITRQFDHVCQDGLPVLRDQQA